MKHTQKRRPETFTRRILAVVTTDRLDLLAKEQEYLDRIPRRHFGVEAYNVSTKVHRPWWAKGSKLRKRTIARLKASWDEGRRAQASAMFSGRVTPDAVRAKLSKSAKRRWRSPEERARMSKHSTGRTPWNLGVVGVCTAWNKGATGGRLTRKHREKISNSCRGLARTVSARANDSKAALARWRSPEYRAKFSASKAAARREGRLKITMQQAARIQRMHATGRYTQTELARKFDVSGSYMSGILNGPKWLLASN